MIGKTCVGRGFYGCFRYVMGEDEPEKGAHIIGGNLAGRNARELSSEVRLYRQRRADIEKPVWHVPIAFHPDEHLNDAQMQDACTHFLDVFGVDREHHQHLIVRHHDTDHGHAHIIVNRISDQGKLLDLHRDRPRVKVATRQVERDLGLRITVEKDEQFREEMRTTIAQTAIAYPRLTGFCQQLTDQGIMPRFAYRNGTLHGIAYRCEGTEINGSKLGREYSFPGLQKHLGIEYQPERDEPVIKAQYVERKGANASDETKVLLRERIVQTAQPELSLSEFCQRLEVEGITPQFGIRRSKLSALSYHYQGQRTSGAQLGEAYTFKGLQRELGINYQPQQDDPIVKACYTTKPANMGPAKASSESREEQTQTLQGVASTVARILELNQSRQYEGQHYACAWQADELRLSRRSDGQLLMRARWDEAAKQWQATAQTQLQQNDLERLARIQQQISAYERAEQARRRQQQRQRGMDLER